MSLAAVDQNNIEREVPMVDNGSTDAAAQRVREHHPYVTVLDNEERKYAHDSNLAISPPGPNTYPLLTMMPLCMSNRRRAVCKFLRRIKILVRYRARYFLPGITALVVWECKSLNNSSLKTLVLRMKIPFVIRRPLSEIVFQEARLC